jgi:hypothetical protein
MFVHNSYKAINKKFALNMYAPNDSVISKGHPWVGHRVNWAICKPFMDTKAKRDWSLWGQQIEMRYYE